MPFQPISSDYNVWMCNCGSNLVEDEIKIMLSCPETITIFTEVISREKAACYLSNSELKAHSGASNFEHVYLFIYFFKKTYLPPQRNLICRHIPELSAPLCWTAGLFISGCFPQTSDWNAAWNHRLPPCAPRMLCSAASSLLPCQPPGLFRRQFPNWHCAYGSAGQLRQHSPTPGKFPGLRRCKIHQLFLWTTALSWDIGLASCDGMKQRAGRGDVIKMATQGAVFQLTYIFIYI